MPAYRHKKKRNTFLWEYMVGICLIYISTLLSKAFNMNNMCEKIKLIEGLWTCSIRMKLKYCRKTERYRSTDKNSHIENHRGKMERQQVECLERREPEGRAEVRSCRSSSYQLKVKLVIRAERGCWDWQALEGASTHTHTHTRSYISEVNVAHIELQTKGACLNVSIGI